MRTCEYVETPEAAEMIGVTANTLAKWRLRGDGPPFHRPGTGVRPRVRYLPEEIQAWLAAGRITPTG